MIFERARKTNSVAEGEDESDQVINAYAQIEQFVTVTQQHDIRYIHSTPVIIFSVGTTLHACTSVYVLILYLLYYDMFYAKNVVHVCMCVCVCVKFVCSAVSTVTLSFLMLYLDLSE